MLRLLTLGFLCFSVSAFATTTELLLNDVCNLAEKDALKIQTLSRSIADLSVKDRCFRPDTKARDYKAFEKACGNFSLWELMRYRDLERVCRKKPSTSGCDAKFLKNIAKSPCGKINAGTRVGITNGLSDCLAPRGFGREWTWQPLIDDLGAHANATYITLRCPMKKACYLGVEIPHAGGKVRVAKSAGFIGIAEIYSKNCKTGELEEERLY